jgi:AcrR family transcriptional regulator
VITGEDNQGITSGQEVGENSTRARLLVAGLELFATRGYTAVTVGEIEQAVGLVPRRGAMYRHFPSKAALLEAVVQEHLDSIAQARQRFSAAPDGSAVDAREVGLWVLAEMDRQRAITQVLERDGERLVALRDRFRTEVSDAGYAGLASILHLEAAGAGVAGIADVDALAVLLLGALVNLRRSAWTLGARPLGLDDARFVEAWAGLCTAMTSATDSDGPSA